MHPELIQVEPTLAFLGLGAIIGGIAIPAIVKAVMKPAAKVAAKMAGGSTAAKVAKGVGGVAAAGAAGLAIEKAIAPPTLPAIVLPAALPALPGGAFPIAGQGAPVGTVMSQVSDKFGRPFLMSAGYETRIRCPSGYVAVTLPNGARACALKGPARSAGLWKPRPKPLLSAADGRVMRKAERLQKKVKRIAKVSGVNITRTVRVTASGNPIRRRKR